jgi:hypothetical protein
MRLCRTQPIVLGGERGGIRLKVLGLSHPDSTDFWDGNWLRTSVVAHVGGFTGSYATDLRADEFRKFCEELRQLYQTLRGDATFETLEGQVVLVFSGDGLGHVAVKAELMDRAGTANLLRCAFDIDQTYLPAIIESLRTLDATWPVLGPP